MKHFLRQLTPKQFRPLLRKGLGRIQHPDIPLLYPYSISLLDRFFTPRSPSVLIISLPRSGSSWVGSLVGASKDALFLREPLTNSYMRAFPEGPSFFEFEMCKDKAHYRSHAADAFAGFPRFNGSIIQYPAQWDYHTRSKRRVVIKEVNPLVLQWLISEYHPKVIYLVRHPVPVANSFFAQGWTSDLSRSIFSEAALSNLEQKFFFGHQADFWEQSGALQAIVQNLVIDTLPLASDFMIVKYEDLCTSPLEQFAKLFDFCELELTAEDTAAIESSTRNRETYKAGTAGITRDSLAMVDLWRSSVAEENISLARQGYFANHPHLYRHDRWW